jgi:hypothetical protein
MRLNIEKLRKDRTLEPILDYLADPKEAKTFLACYRSKGYSREVRDWWYDMCERILPKFPEPEPPSYIATRVISDGWHMGIKDDWYGKTGKAQIWNLMILAYYAPTMIEQFPRNVFGDKYRDEGVAKRILDDVNANSTDYKILVYYDRNIREDNVEISGGSRLGLLGSLVALADETEMCPDCTEFFTHNKLSTERLLLQRIPRIDLGGTSVPVISMDDLRSSPRLISDISHLMTAVAAQKNLGNICDYFEIDGLSEKNVLIKLEEEYGVYNP